MQMVLITPPRGSRSGARLARAMGIKKLTNHQAEGLVGSQDTVVVNWGHSDLPAEAQKCRVLNKSDAVKKAINKLTAFQAMRRMVQVPPFTEDQEEAMRWVGNGHKVVARHTLTGSGGDGIEILSNLEDFPCEAPMYTLYIPKKSEYRVHVMNGRAFDMQRKMRRRDIPDDKVNWLVRNHNNGFVFGRGDLGDVDTRTFTQPAEVAIQAVGLDFGAVDIIWNEKKQIPYVLEINTAPGLEGETLGSYERVLMDAFWKMRELDVPKYKVASVQPAPRRVKVDFAAMAKAFAVDAKNF